MLVFLSHSTVDAWVASQLKQRMVNVGATVFLAENDIEIGGEFEDAIVRALNAADECVVLLTPRAVVRPYVWVELGIALVVLLYGLTQQDVQSNPDMPVFIKMRNLWDLNDVERYFTELEARVEHRSSEQGGPAS